MAYTGKGAMRRITRKGRRKPAGLEQKAVNITSNTGSFKPTSQPTVSRTSTPATLNTPTGTTAVSYTHLTLPTKA